MHLYLIAKVLFLLLSKDVDIRNADIRNPDVRNPDVRKGDLKDNTSVDI